MLAKIDYRIAAQLNDAGQPEVEVGQVVAGGIGRDGAAGGLAEQRAGGLAEVAAVGIRAVQRIRIQNLGTDGLKLVAHFQRMAALGPRVIEFRDRTKSDSETAGLLVWRPSWENPLTALGIKSAGQIRRSRQAGNAVKIEHARPAETGRNFAGNNVVEAEAAFEERVGVTSTYSRAPRSASIAWM